MLPGEHAYRLQLRCEKANLTGSIRSTAHSKRGVECKFVCLFVFLVFFKMQKKKRGGDGRRGTLGGVHG